MVKKILFTAAFVSALFFAACNSAIYEIVEVEEPVEIKEEPKQQNPVSDIKEDTKTSEKPSENKFSEKSVVSRTFVIQIGAFNDEGNAEKYSNTAKSRLTGSDITVKNIDGLYKIRLGNFNNKDEAINFLQKAKDAGYGDSFVVELTYVKMEGK